MVPRASWDELAARLNWGQGQHISLIGPTNCGKTTLARALLPRRRFVLVLACKPRDPLISSLKQDGFLISRKWPVPPLYERVCFWPKIDSPEQLVNQRSGFREALTDVYRQGGWALYIDELQYVTDARYLGLSPLVELLHQHGRSLDVSVIAGTQRPAHVPLTTYSMPHHLFLWGGHDVADMRRLREIGRADPKRIQAALTSPELGEHEALYVNSRTGGMVITQAPLAA